MSTSPRCNESRTKCNARCVLGTHSYTYMEALQLDEVFFRSDSLAVLEDGERYEDTLAK